MHPYSHWKRSPLYPVSLHSIPPPDPLRPLPAGSQSAGDGADGAAQVHGVSGADGRVSQRGAHHPVQPQLPQPVSPALGGRLVSTRARWAALGTRAGSAWLDSSQPVPFKGDILYHQVKP